MNEEKVDQIKKLSSLLDSQFIGPFGIRFGLDAIIGLIPVVGDFITSGLSLYIIIQATQLGCPPSLILRMAGNVLIDNLFDTLPLVGNFFDFYWKSNDRNLRLLQDFKQNPKGVTSRSRLMLFFVCFFILFILAITAASSVLLIKSLLD
jgi:hypothetical protein